MKKLVIIIPVLLIVIAILVSLIFFFSGKATPGSNTGNTTAAQSVPVSNVIKNTPQGTFLTIGTSKGNVQVNNFYTTNPPINSDGDIILGTTSDYTIVYTVPDSSFSIQISGSFDATRPNAENAFLSVLGISQADACKLKVTEGVPYSTTNPLSGKSFSLSFCNE